MALSIRNSRADRLARDNPSHHLAPPALLSSRFSGLITAVRSSLITCVQIKVIEWAAKRRRLTLHFTPACASWLNQIEIWFSILTRDVIRGGIWQSKDVHGAIKAAAQFIRTHRSSFPGGRAPTQTGHIAVLSIKVYSVFLKRDGTSYAPTDLASAIIATNRDFNKDIWIKTE